MKRMSLIILLLVASVSLAAQQNLPAALQAIGDWFSVQFIYDSGLQPRLEALPAVDLRSSDLTGVLDKTLSGSGISWQRRGNNIILKAVRQQPVRRSTVTVSGFITDAASSETLIGAAVMLLDDADVTVGAVSNEFGFYTVSVQPGSYRLVSAHLGYDRIETEITVRRDTTLNFSLLANSELEAARVVSRKDAGIHSVLPGAMEIPVLHIKNMPSLLGESDLIKSLQMLPGVQGGVEGLSGLHVRGGGPEENLILLDGVPIYNVDHMLGLFSIFQTEAVKDVTLYKGTFPARYGGRISSILDIRTNDGNMKETHGSFTVGVLNDKLHLEGPIIKDKLSYSVSARGLHSIVAEPFLRTFLKNTYVNYYYYDLHGKLCWRLSDRDKIYAGLYHGRDNGGVERNDSQSEYDNYGELVRKTDSSQKIDLGWGSTVGSLRWSHVWTGTLFSNATVFFDRYDMNAKMSSVERKSGLDGDFSSEWKADYRSGITDIGARFDFDWTPAQKHLVKFGAGYLFHNFRPERFGMQSTNKNGTSYLGSEASLYAEDNIRLGAFVTLNPGLHLTCFNTEGRNYWSLQPRAAAKVDIPVGIGVKAGYSRMAQYVHLLSSSTITLPLDIWVPITKDIKPVTSDQFSLGACYSGLKGWEFSVEAYLKKMQNLLEYKEGVLLLGNTEDWEKQVEMGKGDARGLEFMVRKTSGKTTGWVSYTLARSERQFDNINLGRPFPYKYDRRHTMDVVVNHKFSDKVDVSASWMFASGGWMTMPMRHTRVMYPYSKGDTPASYVSGRNNYNLPPTHRLNLGVNLHNKTRKGNLSTWSFSLYNAYNAMNPNFVMYDNWGTIVVNEVLEEDVVFLTKWTILPILPAFSYTLNF